MIEQIADAYEELDDVSECRVVILSSQGKNFCAGANFGQDEDMLDKSVHILSYIPSCKIVQNKKPVLAVIQGAAIGGGLGLALSADFRIACPEARFAANFAKLGFHPGFGSSVTLPKVIGDQKAKDMLFSARRVAGEEAYEIGLADRLTSKENLMTEAVTFAETIASSAPMAVESIRSTLRGNLAEEVEKIVDWELSEQVRLQKTEDFKAGIAASLTREVPRFNRK